MVPKIKTIAIPVKDWRRNRKTKSQIDIIEYKIFSNSEIFDLSKNKKYHKEKIDIFTSSANLICEINNEISRISLISTSIRPNNAALLIKALIVTELIKNRNRIFSFLLSRFSEVPITKGKIKSGSFILISFIAYFKSVEYINPTICKINIEIINSTPFRFFNTWILFLKLASHNQFIIKINWEMLIKNKEVGKAIESRTKPKKYIFLWLTCWIMLINLNNCAKI